MSAGEGEEPPLPPGRNVGLAGRGSTFVRESDGPPGAASVVLLHGWTATADLNWFTCYEPLGRHYRVVAPDLRGHGRGPRSRRPFRLEDVADDVAALRSALDLAPPVVLVGYSMGGAVAQLALRRHPGLFDGVVLCATSARFTDGDIGDRIMLAGILGLSFASRVWPPAFKRSLADNLIRRRLVGRSRTEWAASELARGDTTALIEAGASLRSFDSSGWVGTLGVPAAVVMTSQDRVVTASRQWQLASSVGSCPVFPVEGDHGVCVDDPGTFVPALLAALDSVLDRGAHQPQAASIRRAAVTTAPE